MSDRIAVMNGGVVEQCGSPEEVYEQPARPFVAGFIGISNLMEGTVEDGGVRLAGGARCVGAACRRAARTGTEVQLSVRPEKIWLDEHEEGMVAARGHGRRARLRRHDDAGDRRARPRRAGRRARAEHARLARRTTAGRSARRSRWAGGRSTRACCGEERFADVAPARSSSRHDRTARRARRATAGPATPIRHERAPSVRELAGYALVQDTEAAGGREVGGGVDAPWNASTRPGPEAGGVARGRRAVATPVAAEHRARARHRARRAALGARRVADVGLQRLPQEDARSARAGTGRAARTPRWRRAPTRSGPAEASTRPSIAVVKVKISH